MRKQMVLTVFMAGITAAWWAISPQGVSIFPLVDASGAASGWWALRHQALLLSGLLSAALMSLCMVLALRLPWIERPLGGMDQVYRLHKWAGIAAGVTAIAHWGAKESKGIIKDLWGSAGRPAREAMLTWASELRSPAKEMGEIAFYILLGLLLVTLWQQLLNYRNWRWTHRVMPLVYLALVCHSLVLMPARFWGEPLGAMFVVFGGAGSIAACISLLGRVGRPRRHVGRVESVRLLGEPCNDAPLELVCAMPPEWKGHRPGQFVYAAFDAWEGAHPFTIASAPEALGRTSNGEPLLRLVIKPLGDFTDTLAGRLHAGQSVTIEGPYGRFDARGSARRQQVWVAAGVGITPFLAVLEARQPSAQTSAQALGKHQDAEVEMHYCTRNAANDALLERIQQLCAQAQPPVHLTVHDGASGHLFTPQALAVDRKRPSDIWFCGPRGLGAVLRSACRSIGRGRWHLHHELFSMR